MIFFYTVWFKKLYVLLKRFIIQVVDMKIECFDWFKIYTCHAKLLRQKGLSIVNIVFYVIKFKKFTF